MVFRTPCESTRALEKHLGLDSQHYAFSTFVFVEEHKSVLPHSPDMVFTAVVSRENRCPACRALDCPRETGDHAFYRYIQVQPSQKLSFLLWVFIDVLASYIRTQVFHLFPGGLDCA